MSLYRVLSSEILKSSKFTELGHVSRTILRDIYSEAHFFLETKMRGHFEKSHGRCYRILYLQKKSTAI
jgi:hypothetical protein